MLSDLVRIFSNLISSQKLPLQLQRRPAPRLTPCCTLNRKEKNPQAQTPGPRHLRSCLTSPPLPHGAASCLELKGAPFHCLCLHSLWPCLLNTNPCLKKVLSASNTQLQTVFPSTTRYHLIRAAGSELSLSGLGRYREKLWEEVSAHGPGSALQ